MEDVDNVIVAPTVPYGVCPYHLSFEGSINIGYEGLYMVLHGRPCRKSAAPLGFADLNCKK